MVKRILVILLVCGFSSCSKAQESKNQRKAVGGPCEGCEAAFEYGDLELTSTDTLPDYEKGSPKITLSGTVFHKDGKTPAENVVLYVYHTDRNGIYPKRGSEKGWARRHGYLRAWLKTDASGKYSFHTVRPASYPNGSAHEHIHITVLESDKAPYYIDSYVFDNDPLLTAQERKRFKNRGGSGIIRLTQDGHLFTGHRDIILGQNIPDYN